MKKHILNIGVSATHDLITTLGGLNEAPSISDFEAFAFDAMALVRMAITPLGYIRMQNEIRDLVAKKGGVVISLLRQVYPLGFAAGGRNPADSYGLLDNVASDGLTRIRSALHHASGSQIKVVPDARGPSAQYLRVLGGVLRFAAYLDIGLADLAAISGTIFAVDSVQHAISLEFTVGVGRVCFVPVPDGATGDRVGSAIVRLVEAHYGGPSEIEVPPWAVEVRIPGATIHDASIAALKGKKEQIEAEIGQLEQKRTELLNYRILLFGYGKSVLEPIVRSAFRLLDFEVPEPDQYKGEWDVELHEPRPSATAICEVEGSEGNVDVDKYRQLLDYVQAEALEERDHKGILVGNGYRLTPQDAPERQKQFSNHALAGAKKNQFCLLPTTELFKAVCAVLDAPEDKGQKRRIRDSILSTVGIWAFAREATEEQAQAAVATSKGEASSGTADTPSHARGTS